MDSIGFIQVTLTPYTYADGVTELTINVKGNGEVTYKHLLRDDHFSSMFDRIMEEAIYAIKGEVRGLKVAPL